VREKTIRVARGTWCNVVQRSMMRYARKSAHSGHLAAVCWLAVAAGLAAVSTFVNVAVVGRSRLTGEAKLSSLLATFRKIEVGSDGSGHADQGPKTRKQLSYAIGK